MGKILSLERNTFERNSQIDDISLVLALKLSIMS